MFNLFNFKKAKQTQNKILSNGIITRNNYLDTFNWINYLPDPDPI